MKETRMSDRVLIWIFGGIVALAVSGLTMAFSAGNQAREACERVSVNEVKVEHIGDGVKLLRNDISEIKRDVKELLRAK
jgi:hypothetical protein